MPNIKNSEFDIIFQKINQVYPSLSLQTFYEDILSQEGKTSRSTKKLYQFFLNNKKSELENIILKVIPVLQHKDFQIMEKLFIFANKHKYFKKANPKELAAFLRDGLHFVEILSGVEEGDWNELASARQQFFTQEIVPLVNDFRRNKIKYYWWLLKNCI